MVFTNVSSHGPYDLVAIKGHEVLKIDSKVAPLSAHTSLTYGTKRRLKAARDGAVLLWVDPLTRTCTLAVPLDIPAITVPCRICGTPFVKKMARSVFCGHVCAAKAELQRERDIRQRQRV